MTEIQELKPMAWYLCILLHCCSIHNIQSFTRGIYPRELPAKIYPVVSHAKFNAHAKERSKKWEVFNKRRPELVTIDQKQTFYISVGDMSSRNDNQLKRLATLGLLNYHVVYFKGSSMTFENTTLFSKPRWPQHTNCHPLIRE